MDKARIGAFMGIQAVLLLGMSRPASSQEINKWVKARINEYAQVAVNTRSTTNQTQTPSVSENTTSLLDTSSAADLAAIALNLKNLSGSAGAEDMEVDATSASATVSAYALYSAALGKDPLDPNRYCEGLSPYARMLSGTLGFDDEKVENASDDRVIIAGAKIEIPLAKLDLIPKLDGRDVCRKKDFGQVQAALEKAGGQFSRYQTELVTRIKKEGGDTDKLNHDEQALKGFLDDKGIADDFDRMFADTGGPFADLADAVDNTIREFERAPKFAIQYLTKQRDERASEHKATLIADFGLSQTLMAVANGSWDYLEGGDHGGSLAVALEWKPSSEVKLTGRGPLRITLASSSKWLEEQKPLYKGQLKVVIPLLDGVELPLSMTLANRTELVDEAEVRGIVGFTLDTTRLLALLN